MTSIKNNIFLISALLFFLLANTSYYWEPVLGSWAWPAFTLGILLFAILVIALLWQAGLMIKEKFSNRQRCIAVSVAAITLLLSFLKPTGLINFERFENKDLLIAGREGAANCHTTFKLKTDFRFIEQSACFGIEKITGGCTYRNDTIFFDALDPGRHEAYYRFALIKKSGWQNKNIIGELAFYKDNNDTKPHTLWITKNELSTP